MGPLTVQGDITELSSISTTKLNWLQFRLVQSCCFVHAKRLYSDAYLYLCRSKIIFIQCGIQNFWNMGGQKGWKGLGPV